MTRRHRHRVRRDTAAPAPRPGGETRKCSGLCGPRAGKGGCRPGLWASRGRELALPRVIEPALRPGGEGLHAPPLLASWREDERAELGPGSRRGVGFLSLPTPATPPPRHLPGRRTFARLLPAGVALPDHASRVPRSGVPSSPLRTSQSPGYPGPRKASRSRGTLGTGPATLGRFFGRALQAS